MVHISGILIHEVMYSNRKGIISNCFLARLETLGPGSGAGSFSLRTLVSATGLV